MSTNNNLLEERFHLNMARINGLVNLLSSDIDPLRKGRLPFDNSYGARADILRAIVVFLHATFEDCLRTAARERMTAAREDVLNDIPLVGTTKLERREKFALGGLVVHRGKTVDQVIGESVQDYLNHRSFNSCSDVEKVLRQIDIDSRPFKHLYPPFNQMMKRRHRIVHEADLSGPSAKISEPWTLVDDWQLMLWLVVVPAFYSLLRMSVDPADNIQRKNYQKYTKAIDGFIDYGKQIVSLTKKPPDLNLWSKALEKLTKTLNSVSSILSSNHQIQSVPSKTQPNIDK